MDGVSKTGLALSVFLGACLWASPGFTGEEGDDLFEDDSLVTSEVLSDDEMANQRAGDAIAENHLTQTTANTIEGAETVEGGMISLGTETFAHQSMNVNVVNSGNNTNIQASAAFSVNIYNTGGP